MCACFSSSSSKCSRSDTLCRTVAQGGQTSFQVVVDNMRCNQTDVAYLDVEVKSPTGTDLSCSDWQVQWTISE